MKKTKKLLSLLTALTITASAFAGLAVPASAAELYAVDVSGLTSGAVTKKLVDNGYTSATETDMAKASVADFGTATTDAKLGIAAIPALDGWGYKHFANSGLEVGKDRETSAVVDAANNTVGVQGVGVSGCNGAVSFIPKNVDSLALPTTGSLVYTAQAVVTTTGGGKVGSPDFGFTKASDGAAVDSVASVKLLTSGVNNEDSTYDLVMVNDLDNDTYSIYVDGIREKTGSSADITGIYAQSESNKYVKSCFKNLKLTTDVPEAVKVSFIGDANAELKVYDSVITGTKLEAPEAPTVKGKTFKEWHDAGGNAVTEFAAGDSDTVYTAVYEEGQTVSNVIVETTPYSKLVLTKDGTSTTYYTNNNGEITIEDILKGEYTYSLSKTGYTTKTGSFTLTNDDYQFTDTLELDAQHTDYSYFESDFEEGKGSITTKDRLLYTLMPNLTLPSVSTLSFKLTIDKDEETHATILIKNKNATNATKADNTDIVGFQSIKKDGTLVAFTGFTGSDGKTAQSGINQTNTVGAYTNSAVIADASTGTFDIEVIINQASDEVIVKCGDKTVSLPKVNDFEDIGAIHVGKYRTDATVTIDEFGIFEPDENDVSVTGDDEFAKIAGKTVTRQYKASPALPVTGETFTWSVTDKATGQAVNGVSIDENGVLSVTDKVTPTTVIISAVSSAAATKKGETEVKIRDVATSLTPTVQVPQAMNPGETQTLSVTKIVDEYKDDVTEYFTPKWSIDGAPSLDTEVTFDTTDKTGKAVAISAVKDETGVVQSVSSEDITITGNETKVTGESGATVYLWDSLEGMTPIVAPQTAPDVQIGDDVVAAVGEKSGKLTAYQLGDVTVKLTFVEGQDPEEYRVFIDNYSKVVDYTANMTEVDISDLVVDDAITGYQVTIADAGKNMLAQEVVEAKNNTVKLPTLAVDVVPAKVEVAPVYETTINSTLAIPADTYNLVVSANNGSRTDVFVNNQMLINNLNQYSDGWSIVRTIEAAADYEVGDVVIPEGYATFNLRDVQGSTTVTGIKVVKAPSIVNRAQRIYVLGDSLVCNYYGVASAGQEGLVRTGWGQVLGDYIIDDVKVTNLANSGAKASGLYGDAFSNIVTSAQPGDIFILEGGYNDYKEPERMVVAMTEMLEKAYAKGMKTFLVTPNASTHGTGWNGSVREAARMREIAKALGDKTTLIDLSAESFAFFQAQGYTTATDALTAVYNNPSDKLHSNYNAANCWAAIVAQNLYKNAATKSIVDTTHTYKFNDGTKDITVGVTAE